jgi:hypothetical protein
MLNPTQVLQVANFDQATANNLTEALGGGVEAISAAGTLSLAVFASELSVTGTMAFTLTAPTVAGQRKRIACVAAASTPIGTVTITNPDTTVGFACSATFQFDTVGQSIELVATAGLLWRCIAVNRAGGAANDTVIGTTVLTGVNLRAAYFCSVTGTVSSTTTKGLPNGSAVGEQCLVAVSTAATTPSGTIAVTGVTNAGVAATTPPCAGTGRRGSSSGTTRWCSRNGLGSRSGGGRARMGAGSAAVTKALADINAIVRFRGDFRNVLRYPDANINVEIQTAWAELYELIANTNEGYWDTKTTVSTVAAQDFVALPSDAWRVRGIDRLDGADYIPMAQIGISDRTRYNADLSQPRAYYLSSRGAELFPTPDQVYTLRVVYTPVAPALDTTQRNYYNGWEEYVVYGTLVRLVLQEDRASTQWKAELADQRARILSGASQRKAQEPEYVPLRDRQGWGDLDRDERWR